MEVFFWGLDLKFTKGDAKIKLQDFGFEEKIIFGLNEVVL